MLPVVRNGTWTAYHAGRAELTRGVRWDRCWLSAYICPFTLIIGVLISFPVYDCHEFVFLYWLTIWFSHLRYHLYFMQHIFVTNKIKCYKFTINNQNRKLLPNCNWLSTHKQCYQLTPHNQNTTLLPIYYRLSQHKTCYYVTIDSKHY